MRQSAAAEAIGLTMPLLNPNQQLERERGESVSSFVGNERQRETDERLSSEIHETAGDDVTKTPQRQDSLSEDEDEASPTPERFVFDGVEYSSYQEMVSAKRKRNQQVLVDLGFLSTTKSMKKASSAQLKKKANSASTSGSRINSATQRRRSSRLADVERDRACVENNRAPRVKLTSKRSRISAAVRINKDSILHNKVDAIPKLSSRWIYDSEKDSKKMDRPALANLQPNALHLVQRVSEESKAVPILQKTQVAPRLMTTPPKKPYYGALEPPFERQSPPPSQHAQYHQSSYSYHDPPPEVGTIKGGGFQPIIIESRSSFVETERATDEGPSSKLDKAGNDEVTKTPQRQESVNKDDDEASPTLERFIFDGVEYSSYQEMVSAKRKRNQQVLVDLGFLSTTKSMKKASSAQLKKKAQSAPTSSPKISSAVQRRRSGRLAGVEPDEACIEDDRAPRVKLASKRSGSSAAVRINQDSILPHTPYFRAPEPIREQQRPPPSQHEQYYQTSYSYHYPPPEVGGTFRGESFRHVIMDQVSPRPENDVHVRRQYQDPNVSGYHPPRILPGWPQQRRPPAYWCQQQHPPHHQQAPSLVMQHNSYGQYPCQPHQIHSEWTAGVGARGCTQFHVRNCRCCRPPGDVPPFDYQVDAPAYPYQQQQPLHHQHPLPRVMQRNSNDRYPCAPHPIHSEWTTEAGARGFTDMCKSSCCQPSGIKTPADYHVGRIGPYTGTHQQVLFANGLYGEQVRHSCFPSNPYLQEQR